MASAARRGHRPTATTRSATGRDLPSAPPTPIRTPQVVRESRHPGRAIAAAQAGGLPHANGAAPDSVAPPSAENAARRRPSEDARSRSGASTRRVWGCGSGDPVAPPLEDRKRWRGAKPAGGPRTSAPSVLRWYAYREPLAAFLAPPTQDRAPPARAHPLAEPVLAHALAVTWLVGGFAHRVVPAFGREKYLFQGQAVKVDFSTRQHYVRAPCRTPHASVTLWDGVVSQRGMVTRARKGAT